MVISANSYKASNETTPNFEVGVGCPLTEEVHESKIAELLARICYVVVPISERSGDSDVLKSSRNERCNGARKCLAEKRSLRDLWRDLCLHDFCNVPSIIRRISSIIYGIGDSSEQQEADERPADREIEYCPILVSPALPGLFQCDQDDHATEAYSTGSTVRIWKLSEDIVNFLASRISDV